MKPFLKIDSFGLDNSTNTQLDCEYVNDNIVCKFRGEFTFISFANKKTEYANIIDYVDFIFKNHNGQSWLNPIFIKNKENITINKLLQIDNYYFPLWIHLITIEFNTCFDPYDDDDIIIIKKLFPCDETFINCFLYQTVDSSNYKSFVFVTDKYWYLIGNAYS
jgi:hypothetical protein